MNRRSFFGRLFGAAAFAKVLPATAALKARTTLGAGYVYAPYIPKYNTVILNLVSSPVVATATKLKARWTEETAQTLYEWHGIKAEVPNRSTCEPL